MLFGAISGVGVVETPKLGVCTSVGVSVIIGVNIGISVMVGDGVGVRL